MKQIPINQNVMSLEEFNRAAFDLVFSGQANYDGNTNRKSNFVYSPAGDVLGGLVWKPVKTWFAGHMIIEDRPEGYLHS
jgi:hypothetical protein